MSENRRSVQGWSSTSTASVTSFRRCALKHRYNPDTLYFFIFFSTFTSSYRTRTYSCIISKFTIYPVRPYLDTSFFENRTFVSTFLAIFELKK